MGPRNTQNSSQKFCCWLYGGYLVSSQSNDYSPMSKPLSIWTLGPKFHRTPYLKSHAFHKQRIEFVSGWSSFAVAMASTRRTTPYQKHHGLQFGVCVSHWITLNSAAVVSIKCLFCVYFGREEKVGEIKSVRSTPSTLSRPFENTATRSTIANSIQSAGRSTRPWMMLERSSSSKNSCL